MVCTGERQGNGGNEERKLGGLFASWRGGERRGEDSVSP